MQLEYYKAYGVRSTVHKFIDREESGLGTTQSKDMSWDQIHYGMADKGNSINGWQLFYQQAWQSNFWTGGVATYKILFEGRPDLYKKFGNLTKGDLQSITVTKGDPRRGTDFTLTGLFSNFHKTITWNKITNEWGIFDIPEDKKMFDIFDHDGKNFFIKKNYNILTSERLKVAHNKSKLMNGNYLEGFFSDIRFGVPLQETYEHNERNKNINKLCLNYWQPGRHSFDHYKEWHSGVYMIHDWDDADRGLHLKRRGMGRNLFIPVVDMTVESTDGVDLETPLDLQAGRPYELGSDTIKFKTGTNGWVVHLYNI